MKTTDSSLNNRRSPWFYVPTLYFTEGLPYVIVNTLSIIFYKNMGASNQFIGLTSIFYLPWVIKMLWGPTVDIFSTKRTWILSTQLLFFITMAVLSLTLFTSHYLLLSLIFFVFVAFISATHDIAVDGFYMLALTSKEQAFFVGVRATFYRLAMIFGSGVLVVLAGTLQNNEISIAQSWSVTFAVAAAIFVIVFLFHRLYLPIAVLDQKGGGRKVALPFLKAFESYFRQPKIVAILGFILLYRLGEALLVKMALPFLMDSAENGGLALATQTVGIVYGTVGVFCLVLGGLIGGWLIAKFGLKRCIWPMAVMLNLPDLAYVYMAAVKPGLSHVYFLVALEQFGYGLGFTAYMVFLMYIAKEPFKTSHFAISTGFMALGMMLPGMVSGYLQQLLGYQNFFLLVVILTIPGFISLFFIPMQFNKD